MSAMTLPARRGRPRKHRPEPMGLEEYVSAREVARRLSLHPRTVLDLVRTGALPATKPFPNKVLIPTRAVQEWLEKHRVPTV
jgi:excisionase family DNA binding protein